MRNHGREFIVGVVFFALLGALGVLTLTFGADAFAAGEMTTFRFDNVAGLAKGSDVWINGLPSGTVHEISIGNDGIVLATVKMKHGLAELDLTGGVKVEVKEKSSLGGAVISVETLKGEEAKAPDVARSPEDVRNRTWTAKAGGLASVGETAMNQLESLSQKNPGFLGKALGIETTGDLMRKVDSLVGRLDAIVADVEKGQGTAGLLLRDTEARGRVDRIIANLESVTQEAKSGEGTFGLLLRDKATADKVRNVVETLDAIAKDVKEGKGSLAKFLKNDTIYDDVKLTAENLKKFTDGLQSKEGLLSRLVNDKKLGDEFEGLVSDARLSIKDLNVIIADIRAGKGTVGRLLTDEALYNDIKDTVRSVQRSFEEARENAPILTFAGFLFKTF